MKRKILTVLFAILLVAFCLTCFAACKPDDKDTDIRYAEIKDCLKSTSERYNSCNVYTYEVQSTFGNNTSRAKAREIHSPIYFESWNFLPDNWTFTPKNDLQSFVREENGQVVAYVNDRDNYYERKVLGTPDDYEKPLEIFPTVFVWDEITLDVSKCNIKYEDGTYTIVTDYDEFELGNFKTLLEFMLENDEKKALSNAVATIKITANENKTTTSFATTLHVDTDGKSDDRNVELTWTFDFAEFEQIDFDNGEYAVLPPTDIEGVYAVTDITKPLQCGHHDSVFKVDLKKGAYYFEYDKMPHVTIRSADNFNDILAFGIFDETVNGLNNDFNYCFNVEEDGQYYVIFEYCDYDVYKLTRCDYDDFYDENNPKTIETNTTGTIEGKYDFDCYKCRCESNGEGLLSIVNTSDTAIDIICKISANFEYRVINVPSGEALNNIPVIEGETTLFVGKTDATQPVEYSLTTSFYQNNNGRSADFDEMPWITTEFGNDYYTVGLGLSTKFVRMHVDTKGLYAFEIENLYEGLSTNLSINVYDANGRQSVDYKNLALPAGDYIVGLSNSSVDLSIAKVRYTLVRPAEDFETTVKLNKVSIAEKDSEAARVYPLSNIENQVIKYRFTLDEESVVIYGDYIFICDANDRFITFGYDLDAIKLAAGEYYFVTSAYYPYYTVAIVVDYDGPAIDYGNMPVLTAGDTVTFETNELQVAYFAIEVEREGRYNFVGSKVRLHDEDMNSVVNVPYTQSFDLKAGTYYALVIIEGSGAIVKMEEVIQ